MALSTFLNRSRRPAQTLRQRPILVLVPISSQEFKGIRNPPWVGILSDLRVSLEPYRCGLHGVLDLVGPVRSTVMEEGLGSFSTN